jgi:hypothetical protein
LVYGQIDGIPELKHEVARVAKNFLDIDVSEKSCIVTTDSMMGSIITCMVAAKRELSRQSEASHSTLLDVKKSRIRRKLSVSLTG